MKRDVQSFKRVLLCLVLVALAGEGLYLLGANLLLRTALLSRLINEKPEKLQVEWDDAWSVVPGRVHVEGLRIRGQNRRLQWFTSAEEARLNIRLVPLLWKRFHAGPIRARGLTWRLRSRLDRRQREIDPALLAPIPGFANPPSPAPEELYPRVRSRNPWGIHLQEIDIQDLRQIWIEEFAYEGGGSIRGDLRFRIRGELAVSAGVIELRGGQLHVGPRLLAERLEARLAGTLEPFVPREVRGAEVFGRLTAALDVETHVSSLRFLDLYLRRAPWLKFDGDGDLRARIEVERGRIAPASRLDLDAPRLVARGTHFEASGSASIQGRARPGPGGSEAELTLRFGEFEIRLLEAGSSFVQGSDLVLIALVHDPVLGTGFDELDVTTTLAESRVTDFDAYSVYLPPTSGLTIHRGSGTVRWHLVLHSATRSGEGEVEVVGERVEVQFEDLRMLGNLRVHGRFGELTQREPGDPTEYAFDIGGSSLELDHLAILGRDRPADGGWWARLGVDEGKLTLSEPLRVQAGIRATLKDSRPLVALFAEKNKLVDLFERLLAVEDVRLTGEVELGRAIDLHRLDAVGQNMELRSRLHFGDAGSQGILFARYGRLSIGVELADGKRDWKLRGAEAWFEAREDR